MVPSRLATSDIDRADGITSSSCCFAVAELNPSRFAETWVISGSGVFDFIINGDLACGCTTVRSVVPVLVSSGFFEDPSP